METRKVQVTGGSSYIITLPKEWVLSAKIKKNDPVGVSPQPDGSLLIMPGTALDRDTLTKEFNVDQIGDSAYLFRLLIGAYISGFANIAVRGRNGIPPHMRDSVISFTQTLIGPEIVEEDSCNIVIKNLLKPTELPFDKTLKRMFLLVRGMHESTISALAEGSREKAEEIIKRDRDVDRLQWLVARQTHMLLDDISLSKKMDVRRPDITLYLTMSRVLERVGDHAIIIATHIPGLIGEGISDKNADTIITGHRQALQMLVKSMEAWQKRDMVLANDNIESLKNLIRSCKKINDMAANMEGEPAVALSYISESIRRTGEYATDISELLINSIVTD